MVGELNNNLATLSNANNKTTVFAAGETVLSYVNACTINSSKFASSPTYPSDLPTQAEYMIEVKVTYGGRKFVYAHGVGAATYKRLVYNSTFFTDWSLM